MKISAEFLVGLLACAIMVYIWVGCSAGSAPTSQPMLDPTPAPAATPTPEAPNVERAIQVFEHRVGNAAVDLYITDDECTRINEAVGETITALRAAPDNKQAIRVHDTLLMLELAWYYGETDSTPECERFTDTDFRTRGPQT